MPTQSRVFMHLTANASIHPQARTPSVFLKAVAALSTPGGHGHLSLTASNTSALAMQNFRVWTVKLRGVSHLVISTSFSGGCLGQIVTVFRQVK